MSVLAWGGEARRGWRGRRGRAATPRATPTSGDASRRSALPRKRPACPAALRTTSTHRPTPPDAAPSDARDAEGWGGEAARRLGRRGLGAARRCEGAFISGRAAPRRSCRPALKREASRRGCRARPPGTPARPSPRPRHHDAARTGARTDGRGTADKGRARAAAQQRKKECLTNEMPKKNWRGDDGASAAALMAGRTPTRSGAGSVIAEWLWGARWGPRAATGRTGGNGVADAATSSGTSWTTESGIGGTRWWR